MPGRVPISLNTEAGYANLQLRWNSSNNINFSHYRIARQAENSRSLTVIQDNWTESTFFDADSTLVRGTTYCYQIEAIGHDGAIYVTSNRSCATFGQLSLWMPSVKAPANGRGVIVPFNIGNANGLRIGKAEIWLNFDPTVIRPTGISPTVLTAGYQWQITVTDTTKGQQLRVSTAETVNPPTLYGNGSLFWLTFDVVGEAGSSSLLEGQEFVSGVGGSRVYAAGKLTQTIPLTITDGLVNVVETGGRVLGDLNGDGVVAPADARLALGIANKTVTPTAEQQYAGDVNGDGVIQAADASMILFFTKNNRWPLPADESRLARQTVNTTTFQLANAPIGPIRTVAITLSATNLQNFAGGEFALSFDTTIVERIEAVTPTGLAADFNQLIYNANTQQNRILISLANNTNVMGDGNLLTLQLALTDTTTVEEATLLRFNNAILNDANGRDFVTSFPNNRITRQPAALVRQSKKTTYLPVVVK